MSEDKVEDRFLATLGCLWLSMILVLVVGAIAVAVKALL